MIIQFAAFAGMQPGVTDKLLPKNAATLAKDVDLSNGSIRPLRAKRIVSGVTLGKTGSLQTLYRMIGGTWLHWTEAVNVARIPIENNDNDRVIYTGTDQPRMTDATKAVQGGGTQYPEVSFYAGLPAPGAIIEAAVTQTAPEGLQIQWDISGTVNDTIGDKVARVYVYTFVTAWGEEGPPSDPSKLVYVNDDSKVTLSNFAGMPTGAYQISAVRIYRSLGGESYLFVGETSMPVTTYVDVVADADLGEALDTTLYSAPPSTLTHVVSMANGMLAGIDGNSVRFCEPYQGHAWPEDYAYHMDYVGSGLAAAGNYLFITTDGSPYFAVGTSPSVMSFNKLETEQTIVSARSLVDTGESAIYAAADGLVMVSATGAALITRDVVSEEYWRSLDPETMHAYLYKGNYLAFFNSASKGQGGFVFDFRSKSMVLLSDYCTAAFSDQNEGHLYMAISQSVYRFDDDSQPMLSGQWVSKEEVTQPTTFGAGKVDADSYPVTFKLYGDGVLRHTQTVTSIDPFRLPGGYRAEVWKVDISGDVVVDGVVLASTMSEIR